MVDYIAFMKARMMEDHATPPARMSGGDRPLWNANIDFWMEHCPLGSFYVCSDDAHDIDGNPIIVSGVIEWR